MSSLYESDQNAAIVRRIEALTPESRPVWGKMSVTRMLEHCCRPLEHAAGERKMKRALLGYLLGALAKKMFVAGDKPFQKNGPTDPRFVVTEDGDFGQRHAALLNLVKRYGATGVLTTDPHPFFGKLSRAEWDHLMWKHLDHHLRQFGV